MVEIPWSKRIGYPRSAQVRYQADVLKRFQSAGGVAVQTDLARRCGGIHGKSMGNPSGNVENPWEKRGEGHLFPHVFSGAQNPFDFF